MKEARKWWRKWAANLATGLISSSPTALWRGQSAAMWPFRMPSLRAEWDLYKQTANKASSARWTVSCLNCSPTKNSMNAPTMASLFLLQSHQRTKCQLAAAHQWREHKLSARKREVSAVWESKAISALQMTNLLPFPVAGLTLPTNHHSTGWPRVDSSIICVDFQVDKFGHVTLLSSG